MNIQIKLERQTKSTIQNGHGLWTNKPWTIGPLSMAILNHIRKAKQVDNPKWPWTMDHQPSVVSGKSIKKEAKGL